MRLSLGLVAASALLALVRGGSVHQPHEAVRAGTPERPPKWKFDGRGYTQISLPNNRSAVVHISSAYDHAKSHPLILDFHGAGVGAEYQTLVDNVMNDTLRLDGRDIITVYGQGTPGLDDFVVWQGAPYSSGANDLEYTQQILDVIKGNLTIDLSRVYAVGISNGGGFVNLLACTPALNKNFAAFALSSPALYAGTKAWTMSNETCDTGGHPINLIDIHGYYDDNIQYFGRTEQNNDTSYALPNKDVFRQAWVQHNGCSAKGNQTIAPTRLIKEYHGRNATRAEWDCPKGQVVGITPWFMGHWWLTAVIGWWDETPLDIIPFLEKFQLNTQQLAKL